jgi:hypothetical protein
MVDPLPAAGSEAGAACSDKTPLRLGEAAGVAHSERVGFAHALQAVQVERTVTHKKSGKETTGSRQFIVSITHQPGATGATQEGDLPLARGRGGGNERPSSGVSGGEAPLQRGIQPSC